MKRAIRIHIEDREYANWIGGLYYKRNIIFSMLQNSKIRQNYNIIVNVNEKHRKYFEVFINCKELIIRNNVKKKYDKIISFALDILFNVKYVFDSDKNKWHKFINSCFISWIPDFQHLHYPDYFTEKENVGRTNKINEIYRNNQPLILSSKDALGDFEKYFGTRNNVFVIPFVSFIEPELKVLTPEYESAIIKKYEMDSMKYVCICNQFWKHKNHIVVFEAIKLLFQRHNDMDVKFVFTGSSHDYRNPEYYASIKKVIDDDYVKPYIKMLGFIDRIEQLAIMKNSSFIIQPSLFEGWGIVVEDAKVLDKLMILSDIPVHHEQMNENCILFDPHDPNDLVDKILIMLNWQHDEDIGKGLADMYCKAELYSQGFINLFEENKCGKSL